MQRGQAGPTIRRWKRRGVPAALLALAMGMAACGGSSAGAGTRTGSTGSAAAFTTHRAIDGVTTRGPASARSARSAARSVPASAGAASQSPRASQPDAAAVAAAREQWLAEGLVVSSAVQNAPLALAVADLQQAITEDPAATAALTKTIAAIEDFERIPLTDVTPAQSAEANADATTVDAFFGMSGSAPGGGCGPTPTPAGMAAAAQWDAEPPTPSSGAVTAPLSRAAADLQQAVEADPADTTCYPAAIDDLDRLASAPAADVAASGAAAVGSDTPAGLDGAAIAYLNDFFSVVGNSSTDVLTSAPAS